MESTETKPPPLGFIALGSNLGDSVRVLREAALRLETISGPLLQRSSLWESSPVDCPPGSPNFVNAVVTLQPRAGETPESLLNKLQTLERALGRSVKTMHNEPRTLDLDLISFGQEKRATQNLTLPHPRAHERRFVLQPLSEIAPHLILPGQTKTVAELLAELKPSEVLRHLGSL